ncbi:protein-glutamate O-methyltransferase CheR [Desulfonatronum sp. SC1]|uniref:CheR family methyltransferase n=1 Tax=Desulfonatronum sp. SC1 TaxID=2109626 RepID=UPI000D320F7F|nr:protein-glutamate O-methyltransferase CheR [Desulfonatronum sp. SC1]PTN32176.1 chemotaxis protein [Desulfonatronum sp. SC1]
MALSTPSTLSLRQSTAISTQEFAELRQYIYDLSGIDIPERRKYLLENRLGPRLAELGLRSYGEYTMLLRRGPNKDEELKFFFSKITTNETSFFRDLKQLDVFEKFVLKEVLEERGNSDDKTLHIWSAGCSSGEEPYTLGIMLHEALRMSILGWKIRITANDLSPDMIAKAREGLYGEHSLRTTSQDITNRYFTKEPSGYRIHPKVKKLVSLGLINLNDKLAVKRVPRSHIIFCRNVIIYFDDAMKQKVIAGFYDNLLPGGYLVLGHSETIHKHSRAFKPLIKPGGIVYRKEA